MPCNARLQCRRQSRQRMPDEPPVSRCNSASVCMLAMSSSKEAICSVTASISPPALEALAEPGSIYVSAPGRDHIGNKLPLGFDDLGDQQVKNIAQAIRVYRVQTETSASKPITALPLPDKPSIAVLPFQNMSGDPEQE